MQPVLMHTVENGQTFVYGTASGLTMLAAIGGRVYSSVQERDGSWTEWEAVGGGLPNPLGLQGSPPSPPSSGESGE